MDKPDGGFDAALFARRFDQFSPEYAPHLADIYREMRAGCPVAHTDAAGGFWIVTRYADIVRVARDHETFASRYGVRPSANPAGGSAPARTGPLAAAYAPGPNGEAPRLGFIPLELDPPLHGVYRKVIDPVFSAHAVSELAPWLLALADQLIDAIIETGEGDFCRDLSMKMASLCTMKIVGLPLEDWADYAWLIQSATGGSSSVQPRTTGLSQGVLRERVVAEVDRQGRRPVAGGAISHLLDATVDGRRLERWEIEAYVWLIIGTMDAMQAFMASGFVWLSRHPAQRRRLVETPQLLPHAIEEFLRAFPPRQAHSRTVMHDVELAGQALKAGDRVLLSWVSGNLDETVFETPDEVDFDRGTAHHMTFGVGPHRCIASEVVRLEFRSMFGRVLSRMPDFRVEEAGLRPSPVPIVVAGFEHVPFVFTPGTKVGGPRIFD